MAEHCTPSRDRRPLRIRAGAPGAAPSPWLPRLAAALQGVDGVELVASGSAAAADIVLDTGEAGAPVVRGSERRWAIVDAKHRLLAGDAAWWCSLSQAQGVDMTLIEEAAGGWCALRRSHATGPLAQGDGLQEAHAALVAMLVQALVDVRLGVAPDAGCLLPAPRPPVRRGAWLSRLQSRWARGLRRQRSRWLTEHWRVGVVDQPIHALLQAETMPPIQWLTPPDDAGYWADPFGMPGHPGLLFCERYDERTSLGHLECLRLHGSRIEVAGRLPVGRGHASFPNVFEADGQVYGLAETAADRECVLHRVGPQGQWVPVATVLHGVAAADPAIFRWQGRWWLAFTDLDRGTWDNLCLYHAERIEGPWRPHLNNPVKVDVAGARMAGGCFEHEGRLYRPGQDCRAGYGHALALYRVDEVGPAHYRETLVRRLAPHARGEAPEGLHTLTAWGERTLVDGKKLRFNLLALRLKLGRRSTQGRQAGPAVQKGI